MPRTFTPKVITANHLTQGDVIYQTSAPVQTQDQTQGHTQGHMADHPPPTPWTRTLAHAEVLTDEAHAQIRLLEAQAQVGEIVGAYMADVRLDASGVPHPTHFREEFRTRGPSNYPHGKQAAQKDTSHV